MNPASAIDHDQSIGDPLRELVGDRMKAARKATPAGTP
ncbi:MAG: hypothetical protein OJF47_003498 [Nitrospira sp.]|nr:MAG: hypothetical protein OJF47_003498 [Nitrospira sp.]